MTTPSKRILLTGGCGFIGSHVADMLLAKLGQDVAVVNMDKLDYCSSAAHAERHAGDPRYEFVRGDITEASFVEYVLAKHDVNVVMHFAAQSHVDHSFGNSTAFTKNNILGTHVLLEACRRHGKIDRFIHVSTDEVYGTADASTPGRHETALLEPTNPYSASKAGAEMLVKAYARSHKLPVIVTRGNNVYGPCQFPEKIIPKFTLQLMKGRPLTIHGTGANARHYIHVHDVALAFLAVLERGVVGETYNIGIETERTNLEVARDLLGVFGLGDREGDMVVHVDDRHFNDFRYPVNSSKLRSLGWEPTISWEDGLASTVAWYREHAAEFWPATQLDGVLVAHPVLK